MVRWKSDDIDDSEEAVAQRELLREVRQFLLDNDADEILVETIDVAIKDIESWIGTDIEAALTDRAVEP